MPSHRRIRVLHLLEATVGGTREHVLQICRHLDRRTFDVTLLCSTLRDPRFVEDVRALRGSGIPVIVVPMPRRISPLRDLVAFVRILAHVRGRGFDIVHTHSSKAGFLGRLAAWMAGTRRIVHTPHVFYFQAPVGRASGTFFRALEWLAARVTTRIVAVSESQRRIAIRSGVATPAQVVVIENGTEIPRPTPAADRLAKRAELGIGRNDRLVGMAARLAPQKGCEHYLRVARRVLDTCATGRGPRVRFLLAGDGELAPRLRRLAADLDLGEDFVFLGPRDDLPAIYPLLDVFVLTSLWEGLPYAVLEAMAAGKPVVATRVPGTTDVVQDGVTGYLVPPGHEEAAAERVVALLTNRQFREIMGARGRQLVQERFTRDRFIRRLEDLYRGMMSYGT